jgi:hypothetical protein
MSSKTANKKQKETPVIVSETPVIVSETPPPVKDVVEEIESITNEDNEEDEKNDSENEVGEIVLQSEYLSTIKEKTELVKKNTTALSSISSYTKAQLIEIEKEEILYAKANFEFEKKRIKAEFSRLKKNAPKAKKEVKLDSEGNVIKTQGKNPVTWTNFAKDAFGLKTNEGQGGDFLGLIWAYIKSMEGVKDGPIINIGKPGKVNTFFNDIKQEIVKRGVNPDTQKIIDLIDGGVLSNKDITKFSKYCYEVKEKKPKATKKTKPE